MAPAYKVNISPLIDKAVNSNNGWQLQAIKNFLSSAAIVKKVVSHRINNQHYQSYAFQPCHWIARVTCHLQLNQLNK